MAFTLPNNAINQPLIPVIFIVDTSGSMVESKGLEQAKQGLQDWVTDLQTDPVLGNQIRLTLITFSDHAEVVLEHEPIKILNLPELKRGRDGGTKYLSGLQALKNFTDRKRKDLMKGKRPLIVFISDGQSEDGKKWEAQLEIINADNFLGLGASIRHGYRLIAGAGDKVDKAALSKLLTKSNETSSLVTLQSQACIKRFIYSLKTITKEFHEGRVTSTINDKGEISSPEETRRNQNIHDAH
jgi:uncharacterized protein YegL